jgi:hypothetical protein
VTGNGSAHRRCRWGSGFRGPARESGPFSWRGDETQAWSDVADDDPLGGRADSLGDRAVIRVVEIGVTRLRRGEGDDEAVVVAALQSFGAGEVPLDHGEHAGDCADEASNGRPDELLGVDLLLALSGHQDDMADRRHRTRLCLRSGVIPRRTVCRWADLTAVIGFRPNVKPLQRHKGSMLQWSGK